jgi:hypothetical protein
MAKRTGKQSNGNGANLGFEETLWLAADKLRNNLDAAEYKHVVRGLTFLKYFSDAFTASSSHLGKRLTQFARNPVLSPSCVTPASRVVTRGTYHSTHVYSCHETHCH